jgi:cytoskeleton protein RodZ
LESISGKLLAAREAKGVSLEQAARDTHISKRYLVALESEAFDDFPGEAYFLGFLRSYSTYLGLNSDDVVALYRNFQLQEQPAPINELLDRKPRRNVPVLPILIVLLIVVMVVGIVSLFVTGTVRVPSFQRAPAAVAEQVVEYRLSDQFVERRFVEGNRIAVPLQEGEAVFEFVTVGERVAVGSEAGIVEFARGEERLLDITGGGSPDIRVAIRHIYPDEVPPAVVARIDRVLERSPSTVVEATVLSDQDRQEIAIGRTVEPSRERSSLIVTRLTGVDAFPVDVQFSGLTVFRYEADNGGRQEQVLNNGQTLAFSVRDIARLWVSNAGNVRMNVAGTAMDLGRQGAVTALVLRRSDADGTPAVEMLPLY